MYIFTLISEFARHQLFTYLWLENLQLNLVGRVNDSTATSVYIGKQVVRTDGRSVGRAYGQSVTKISRMDGLPNFLTYGALLSTGWSTDIIRCVVVIRCPTSFTLMGDYHLLCLKVRHMTITVSHICRRYVFEDLSRLPFRVCRIEKSHYVTFPWYQNFWMTTNRNSLKKWIRTVSNLIDLISFHFICQMLAKFSGVESERTVFKFRKRKSKLLRFVHLLHKASAWN